MVDVAHRVLLNGVDIHPIVEGGVNITWGRSSLTMQPDAAVVEMTVVADHAGLVIGSGVQVDVGVGGTWYRRASGMITRTVYRPPSDPDRWGELDVVVVGPLARLGRVTIPTADASYEDSRIRLALGTIDLACPCTGTVTTITEGFGATYFGNTATGANWAWDLSVPGEYPYPAPYVITFFLTAIHDAGATTLDVSAMFHTPPGLPAVVETVTVTGGPFQVGDMITAVFTSTVTTDRIDAGLENPSSATPWATTPAMLSPAPLGVEYTDTSGCWLIPREGDLDPGDVWLCPVEEKTTAMQAAQDAATAAMGILVERPDGSIDYQHRSRRSSAVDPLLILDTSTVVDGTQIAVDVTLAQTAQDWVSAPGTGSQETGTVLAPGGATICGWDPLDGGASGVPGASICSSADAAMIATEYANLRSTVWPQLENLIVTSAAPGMTEELLAAALGAHVSTLVVIDIPTGGYTTGDRWWLEGAQETLIAPSTPGGPGAWEAQWFVTAGAASCPMGGGGGGGE